MFNPTEYVIRGFEGQLRRAYHHVYTILEPDYPGIIAYVGNMALQLIANSDAPYHDLTHTLSVTLVGQEIIKGKHLPGSISSFPFFVTTSVMSEAFVWAIRTANM
jgi:hypothetical protein